MKDNDSIHDALTGDWANKLPKRNTRLITPCPVCGLEQECPHTPVRCNHHYQYSERFPVVGSTRKCSHCGQVQKATLDWVIGDWSHIVTDGSQADGRAEHE